MKSINSRDSCGFIQRRLVEKEEARPRREGADDLKATLHSVREGGRRVQGVIGESRPYRGGRGPPRGGRARGARNPASAVREKKGHPHSEVTCDEDVLEDRHPAEKAYVLKGAREPELGDSVRGEAREVGVAIADRPLGRAVHTGYHVEGGGLPPPFGPMRPTISSGPTRG
jgi:hypothetical protein